MLFSYFNMVKIYNVCHNTPQGKITIPGRLIWWDEATIVQHLEKDEYEMAHIVAISCQKHQGRTLLLLRTAMHSFTCITNHTGRTAFNQRYRSYNQNGLLLMNSDPKQEVIERSYQLTNCPSCMASMATLASSSGSLSTSRSALAPRAWPMFPKHTLATSSRLVFTHILAMFSHTDSLLVGK